MNMIDAVKSVLTQYVGFSGRARRSEYWYWILATFLLGVVVGIFELAIGLSSDGSGPVAQILRLALFLPGLAVGFRRLHDTGRSGWWIGGFYLALFVFIVLSVSMAFGAVATGGEDTTAIASLGVLVIIGLLAIVIYAIALIIFFCQDSEKGPNKYGPNPKNEGNYDVFE